MTAPCLSHTLALMLRRRLAFVLVLLLASLLHPPGALAGDAGEERPAKTRGGSILYSCGPDICKTDAKGKRVKRLTRDGKQDAYESPSVSASGKRTSWIRDDVLYVAGSDLKRPKRLDSAEGTGDLFQTDLSPDGQEILYGKEIYQQIGICPQLPCLEDYVLHTFRADASTAAVDFSYELSLTFGWIRDIALYDVLVGDDSGIFIQDGEQARVASLPGFDIFDPAGPPKGGAFAATVEANVDGGAPSRLALFSVVDGHLIEYLTSGDDHKPSFSPDGRTIVFERGDKLFTISAEGGKPKPLGVRGTSPSWGG